MSEKPSPTPGLLSPGFQCREEESLQSMAIKVSEASNHSGDTKSCWKLRDRLKGPAHTHSLAGKGVVPREVPETYTKTLSCEASGEGWRDSHHFCVLSPPTQPAGRHHLACVESSLQCGQI